jgi:ectoine hydroxylase-related dioxygenase (phytanoyl-CoA dioxygenase family)
MSMSSSSSSSSSSPFLSAPVDEEGFVVTFDASDAVGMRDFIDRFGFVCVRDVLDTATIDATIDEFFRFAKIDRTSFESIDSAFARQESSRLGLFGVSSEIDKPQQLLNRANPTVYRAFANLLECEELIVDHGRMGAMRPTFWNDKEVPEWRTVDRWLHIDCHPLTNRVSVASFGNSHLPHDQSKQWLPQGFIALTTARAEDGGFWCVPGSHRVACEWARANNAEKMQGRSLVVEQDDPMRDAIQKIPVRAGTLVVWNNLLFHANHPNRSNRWRIVQYLRMYPVHKTPFTSLWPPNEFREHQHLLTPVARRLFGIEPWDSDKTDASASSSCTIQ